MSFGGGVTAIAVHEVGVPRFVRVLGTGGRELTDAIAAELDLPPETAEALKRQLGAVWQRRVARRAGRPRTHVDRTSAVGAARRGPQLDRLLPQPAGSSPLLRIVVTGGAAQLPGLTDRLVGARRRPGRAREPRELVALGDIGFSEEELPRLDPYLPAAVGLALGGAGVGTVIDLLPRARRTSATSRRPKIAPKTAAIGAACRRVARRRDLRLEPSVSSAKSSARRCRPR